MMTFSKVMEIFNDYLQREACIEVLPTKWGYVQLYYEEPYHDSFDAVLCSTPEELFEVLLDHALAEQEYRLSRETLRTSEEIAAALQKHAVFILLNFKKSVFNIRSRGNSSLCFFFTPLTRRLPEASKQSPW